MKTRRRGSDYSLYSAPLICLYYHRGARHSFRDPINCSLCLIFSNDMGESPPLHSSPPPSPPPSTPPSPFVTALIQQRLLSDTRGHVRSFICRYGDEFRPRSAVASRSLERRSQHLPRRVPAPPIFTGPRRSTTATLCSSSPPAAAAAASAAASQRSTKERCKVEPEERCILGDQL